MNIALIAHDRKKDDMVRLAREHAELLHGHALVATGTTGGRLHREIGYYTDLASGEVIKRWYNPWLQREVEVIPIQNDPVNRRFTVQESGYRFDVSGEDIVFYREVPLRYPNPLDRATYPLNSSGDFYEAMEMFTTFVRRSELDDPRLTSVPSTGTSLPCSNPNSTPILLERCAISRSS